ncbi:MAG TPA: hypothetical protein VFH70_00130 [Acidimicrobiales bacterium]|nr:hypothetical protein [Acidimicrobiales bacterium]
MSIDPEGWVEAGTWLTRARRLGPLRYSDLGRRRLGRPAAVAELATWLAARIDEWWRAAGEADPFTLVVASGDDGTLARAVIDRAPKCATALRYILVDPDHPDPALPPAAMVAALPLENPAFLYPAAADPTPGSTDGVLDGDPDDRPLAQGIGPLFTFLGDIPALGDGPGAIVAIGVVSRLPYDLYTIADGAWREVRAAAEGESMVETEVPVNEPPAVVTPAVSGGRHLVATGAVSWLREVLVANSSGILAVVDDDLPAEQLAAVHRPTHPSPESLPGTPYLSLMWHMGRLA